MVDLANESPGLEFFIPDWIADYPEALSETGWRDFSNSPGLADMEFVVCRIAFKLKFAR